MELIDPFDNPNPQAVAPVPQAVPQPGELVDPFDDPSFKPDFEQQPQAAPPVSQDTAGAADISDVAMASLAEDPKARIRFFAEKMGIPEDNFGVISGQIVFRKDDGSFQAVAPGMLRKFVKGVGPSMPAVGGAVGSIAGAPFGPPGIAGGGLTGAVAGQTIRDFAAEKITGQPMTPGRPIREGAIDLGATVFGLLLGKGVSRALATKAVKEFKRVIGTSGENAMVALKESLDTVNKRFGTNIKLTPAELSNSPELRAQQLALQNDSRAAIGIEDFTNARAGQLDTAVERSLDAISVQRNSDLAGEGLRDAAGTALKQIEKERGTPGSQAFQKAFGVAEDQGGVDIRPALEKLDEIAKSFPGAAKALKAIRRNMVKSVKVEGKKKTETLQNDLEFVQDNIKEALDDAIQAAGRKGKKKLASRIQEVQKTLLNTLDEQVDEFKVARNLWEELSGPVNVAQGGVLPQLANRTPKDFEFIGTRFFSGSSPAELARAKERILATEGGEEKWNAALRGFLADRWEAAGRVFKSTVGQPSRAKGAKGVSFFADLFGNPAQRKRLKASMSREQFFAFSQLMDVFEATGRAINFNSTTAAQQTGRALVDPSGALQATAKSVVNPLGIFRRLEGGVNDILKGMNLKTLVDVITNTDSVKELLRVGGSNSGRDRLFLAAAKAINIARTQAASPNAPAADFAPPSSFP